MLSKILSRRKGNASRKKFSWKRNWMSYKLINEFIVEFCSNLMCYQILYSNSLIRDTFSNDVASTVFSKTGWLDFDARKRIIVAEVRRQLDKTHAKVCRSSWNHSKKNSHLWRFKFTLIVEFWNIKRIKGIHSNPSSPWHGCGLLYRWTFSGIIPILSKMIRNVWFVPI